MRVISKKISYDNLISRLPGVITSIMDSWEIPDLYGCVNGENKEVFYSYDSAVNRAHEYNINSSLLEYDAQFVEFDKNNLIEFSVGNYGLIPSDVVIPSDIASKITDYTDIYVNIPDGEGGYYDLSWPKSDEDPHYEGRKIISGGTEVKILTYYTLNKWYLFFKEYYTLINSPEQTRIYESAVDYYNKMIKVKNEEQLAYYQSLDDTFNSRGGKKMYNWISNNCIIQYQIPAKFAEKWNTTFLYYPDAIKWYYWFKIRSEYYKDIENANDCKDVDPESGGSCCDCSEFFKLGGKEFYDDLKAWVDGVEINTDFMTKSASITIPISITNSIDDLGEMSIFSSKWEDERDYHNTENNDKHGTIVDRPHIKHFKCKCCGYEGPESEFTDNKCPNCQCKEHNVLDATLYETYIIKPGLNTKGYIYNQYYEDEFNSEDWEVYTNYYIKNAPEEFVTSGIVNGNIEEISAYTFSPINGKVIYNPEEITEEIHINNLSIVCINGSIYEVIDGKYVTLCYATDTFANIKYKKQAKLPIVKDGVIEYTTINGKKKYVETDDEGVEKVYFLKESNCHDDGCEVEEGKYILYDSCLYLVEGNNVTINDDESTMIYPVLDGYFYINGNVFYISGNSVVVQDSAEYNEGTSAYTYTFRELNDDELRVYSIKELEVSDDKTYVTLYYDFVKNDCRIISGYTDSKLDILRRKEITTDDLGNELPGYFKSIVDIESGTTQSKYNVPYDECTLDILYKVGEVSDLKPINIDKTKFIGNIITDIKFYYADEFRNPIEETEKHAMEDDALKAIEDCKSAFEELEDDSIPNVMYCDITYHLGAVINVTKNGHATYSIDKNTHVGVTYIDTVYVTKRVGTYYLNDDKYFTYKYYFLSQDVDTIDLTDFNTDTTWDASTYFEIEPMLYISPTEIYHKDKFNDFENNNGVVVSPLVRTEFNLASSMPQNVEADIYIDRGISAAFEKHLKLQEFRSMESLENYGNRWFKINKY